jgi:hypothetical protein
MLHAQFLKRFFHQPGTPGLHALVGFRDGRHGFRVILLFPFKVVRQNGIERGGSVLSMSPGVIFKLRFPFGSEGNQVHAPKVRTSVGFVNRRYHPMAGAAAIRELRADA